MKTAEPTVAPGGRTGDPALPRKGLSGRCCFSLKMGAGWARLSLTWHPWSPAASPDRQASSLPSQPPERWALLPTPLLHHASSNFRPMVNKHPLC